MRDCRFDRFPDAGQVDVDHVGPVRFTCVVQRLPAVADTCVCTHDVESTQLLNAAVDRRPHRGEITDVDFRGDDSPVQLLDQIRGFCEIVRGCRRNLCVGADRTADVERDDVGTLGGQPYRVTTSLTACRPCDECDLAERPTVLGEARIDASGQFLRASRFAK